MTFISSLRFLTRDRRRERGAPASRKPHRSRAARPRSLVPRLESLEGRLAPALLTVNTLADETVPDGGLSLREAIGVVNSGSTAGLSDPELGQISGALGSGDTIQFDSSLAGGAIVLTSGELAISQSLTIAGLGADQLTISRNNAGRVFDMTGSAATNVEIDNLTIANGLAAEGGGILNSASSLSLVRVALSNNQAVGAAGSPGGGTGGDGFGGGLAN